MKNPVVFAMAMFLFSCTNPSAPTPGAADTPGVAEPNNKTPDSIPAKPYSPDKGGLDDTAMENQPTRKLPDAAGNRPQVKKKYPAQKGALSDTVLESPRQIRQ